ncbi:RNA polymerase sigma factor [Rudanella lutea]|uniref:RNA polymerase sigma factor n=1 Tax=Rudanella lutea TaxID=451374 RepID=UPI000A0116B1|nr:sigma-70 family RNA polymerase sigma factor [Rudanella lutea]
MRIPLSKESLRDEELVQLYLNTRQAVYFDALYIRYQSKVISLCSRYTKRQEDAKDLSQDLFLKVLARLDSFSGTARFSTWVYSVTQNLCYDHLRRQDKILIEVVEESEFLQMNLAAAENEESFACPEQLRKSMETLNNQERKFIRQHYFDQLSIRDMAQQNQLSESAVKMRLMRARGRLRQNYIQFVQV